MSCTEKYQSQVSCCPTIPVGNYVCGQPFPNASITKSDPEAGWKAAWNYEYRWQNFGFSCIPPATWDRFGGTHDIPTWDLPPTDWMASVRSFGIRCPTIDSVGRRDEADLWRWRKLPAYADAFYQQSLSIPISRCCRSHTLPVPGAANFEFKEFTGFSRPLISAAPRSSSTAMPTRIAKTTAGPTFPTCGACAVFRPRLSRTRCWAPTIRWRTSTASPAVSSSGTGASSDGRISSRSSIPCTRTPICMGPTGSSRTTRGRCAALRSWNAPRPQRAPSVQERRRGLGFAELRRLADGSVRPQGQAVEGMGVPEEVERNLPRATGWKPSTRAPSRPSSSRSRCSTCRTIAAPSGSFLADSRTLREPSGEALRHQQLEEIHR